MASGAQVDSSKKFRLVCPKCKDVMVCDASIVVTGGCCASCGHPVQIDLYEPLRDLRQRLEDERAKKASEEHERKLLEKQRKREDAEAERQRRADEAGRRQEVIAKQKREREREQLQENQAMQRRLEADERERFEQFVESAGHFSKAPNYGALLVISGIYRITGVLCLIAAVVLVIAAFSDQRFILLAFAVAIAWSGLCSLAFAQGLRAFHDLSVNSWKQIVLLRKIAERPHDSQN